MAVSAVIDGFKNEGREFSEKEASDLHSGIWSIISDAMRKAGATDFRYADKVPGFDWESVRIKVNKLFESGANPGSKTES